MRGAYRITSVPWLESMPDTDAIHCGHATGAITVVDPPSSSSARARPSAILHLAQVVNKVTKLYCQGPVPHGTVPSSGVSCAPSARGVSCAVTARTCQRHNHVGVALPLQLTHPRLRAGERVWARDVVHDDGCRGTPVKIQQGAARRAYHMGTALLGGDRAAGSNQTRGPPAPTPGPWLLPARQPGLPVVHWREAVVALLTGRVPAHRKDPQPKHWKDRPNPYYTSLLL